MEASIRLLKTNFVSNMRSILYNNKTEQKSKQTTKE